VPLKGNELGSTEQVVVPHDSLCAGMLSSAGEVRDSGASSSDTVTQPPASWCPPASIDRLRARIRHTHT
jgi:hypothetical protein